jgi:hypothetical protein
MSLICRRRTRIDTSNSVGGVIRNSFILNIVCFLEQSCLSVKQERNNCYDGPLWVAPPSQDKWLVFFSLTPMTSVASNIDVQMADLISE